MKKRTQYTAEYKASVVLRVLRECTGVKHRLHSNGKNRAGSVKGRVEITCTILNCIFRTYCNIFLTCKSIFPFFYCIFQTYTCYFST